MKELDNPRGVRVDSGIGREGEAMKHELFIENVQYNPTGTAVAEGYCETCYDGSNGWFGEAEDVVDQFKEHVNG